MLSKKSDVLPSYEEIENAPVDETNKKYGNFSKEIDLPDHEIVGISPEYITENHTVYRICESFSKYTGHTIVINDNKNNEVYNCKLKRFQSIIYDCNNTPLVNVLTKYRRSKFQSIGYFKIIERAYISSGKTENSDYGMLKMDCIVSKLEYSLYVYTTETFNPVTRTTEKLKIQRPYDSREFSVYCNPDSDHETLIAKITTTLPKFINIRIEIAPRVDYMYIFAIALGVYNYIHDHGKMV